MAQLRISNLRRRFGSTDALAGLYLEADAGELLAVLGPSGAGKSTLLKLLAGLQPVDGGKLHLGERDITPLPLRDRSVALVSPTLPIFPQLTVEESLFAASPTPEVRSHARVLLELLGASEVAQRPLADLSGGMQQRVALARALTAKPNLLLLDEPLSQLDALAREALWAQLRPYLRAQGITTVWVTHDLAQAMAWADHLAILKQGRLIQTGSPLDCYRRPADSWTALFLGQANLLPATLVRHAAGEGVVRCVLGEVSAALAQPAQPPAEGSQVMLCLRPEALRLESQGPEENAWRGKITASRFEGELTRHRFVTEQGGVLQVTEANARQRLNTALPLVAWIEPEDAVILSQ